MKRRKPHGMLNLDDVAERTGWSKRHIMRLVDEGRFPKPTTRNGRVIFWTVEKARRRLWMKNVG